MTNSFKWIPYLIILTFVLFAGFIGQFVYRSMQSDTNLVSENYYQEEIDFQDKMNRIKNTSTITKFTKVKLEGTVLNITFKEGWTSISGNAHLYNPSDHALDVSIPFKTNSNQLQFNLDQLKEGYWVLKLTFEYQGIPYYLEEKMNI